MAYETGLDPESYDKLMEVVGPFFKVGRRTGKARKPRAVAPADQDTGAIRAW
ncbi:hypothetical protein [Streptomyces sp. NPDC048644]|uniref:hypothetical protein n=1 Tax=Streptomyces sp. NPDC048644 TaxID=3365582 RepID=UPI00371BD93B